jgi:hypothetical protein
LILENLSHAANAHIAVLTVGQRPRVSPQSGLAALKAAPIRAVMLSHFHALQLAQAFPKLFTVEAKMFAKLGTALVIAQMALLSLEFNTIFVLIVGLSAAICWAAYALKNNDKWLLITNVAVGGFAIYGLA